ncbi:MAG: hypothetical protein QXD11_02355 [Candidatus Micrarchaeaceae archaeon]
MERNFEDLRKKGTEVYNSLMRKESNINAQMPIGFSKALEIDGFTEKKALRLIGNRYMMFIPVISYKGKEGVIVAQYEPYKSNESLLPPRYIESAVEAKKLLRNCAGIEAESVNKLVDLSARYASIKNVAFITELYVANNMRILEEPGKKEIAMLTWDEIKELIENSSIEPLSAIALKYCIYLKSNDYFSINLLLHKDLEFSSRKLR